MQKICLIKTSVGSMGQAETLAAELVEAGLAACVQIAGPGLSIYRWQEKVEQEQEYYLNIKTRPEKCDAVVLWLHDHHPYVVPEIVWAEFHASNAYADWLGSVVE